MIIINVVNTYPIITGKHDPTMSGKHCPAIDTRRSPDLFVMEIGYRSIHMV